MSDTSKSTESRSKSGNGRWNPFRKMMSIVTGRQGTDSDATSSSESDKVILRWTASCLNTTCPIFSKNPQFNMIYSPAPSLLMFVVVTLSSESAMTKTLQRLFELTDDDIEEIRQICLKLNAVRSPTAFYFFVRFLVDEEKTTTVSKELMAKSNEVASQQVFASIRPSRAIKYLNSLCFSRINLARPSLLTTNGYASAGLNATWIGKARKAGLHRFACSYHKKKMEPFFEIRTSFKRTQTELFEVIEVPFQNDRIAYGSFLWLRPHFLGHLPYANRQLTTDTLTQIINNLSSATWQSGRLLLPQFTASGAHDLWKNLMRHGVQPDLGQSQKAPPMASLWHWIQMSVSSEGISGSGGVTGTKGKMTSSQRALQQVCHGRISGDSLYEKHRTYSARIDSPFTYMILINGIPIFTGSYFGSPPPKSNELFVNAPDRIRQRRHHQKRRRVVVKETRKQKLMRKIKKSEEKEKEKDRRREEREKRSRKKNRKRDSEAEGTSSQSQSTLKSDESLMNSPIQKKSEVPEGPEKKSKSSGWKRFTKIFRRRGN